MQIYRWDQKGTERQAENAHNALLDCFKEDIMTDKHIIHWPLEII